jgi:flagellar operon protein
MPQVNGVSVPFVPAGGVNELKRKQSPGGLQSKRSQPERAFREMFEKEVDRLRFSSHAQTRLNSRDIKLSPAEIQKLENAVQKAEAKGAKESLVMMEGMAFIVSVPNKTVITAMNNEQLKDNVFTNIDSAVFVD